MGAEVIAVPVYRWEPAANPRPARRLVEDCCTGRVDAVTFTSAPAVSSVLAVARQAGVLGAFLAALTTGVLPACVGPVCAAPLRRLGVEPMVPERARLGPLVRLVVEQLPARVLRFDARGHRVELRGSMAVVDGRVVPLSADAAAVIRALAAQPGRVLSREQLTAVARLRIMLGPAAGMIRTVVKRGYRLET